MNQIVEHVDTRSDPVETGDETGRQCKERKREQYEKQIAHDIHRYFRIPVESCRSIPIGLDQCMKQIDKERDRYRAGDPQHGFPLCSYARNIHAIVCVSGLAASARARVTPHAHLENGMRQCRNSRIKAVFNFLTGNKKAVKTKAGGRGVFYMFFSAAVRVYTPYRHGDS
ncbi:hypothetical protein [Burkholderia pyrrocinia]